jgi:hypothetical protein
MLLGIALATFCVVLFFLSRSLLLLREQQQEAAGALDTTEAVPADGRQHPGNQ